MSPREKTILAVLFIILVVVIVLVGNEFSASGSNSNVDGHGTIVYGSIKISSWIFSTHTINYGSSFPKVSLPNRAFSEARWSPNGEWIIYSTRFSGLRMLASEANSKIFIVRSSDGQKRQLSVPSGSYEPSWSLDGKKIVYTQFQQGIFVVDVECIIQRMDCESVIQKLVSAIPNPYGDSYFPKNPDWSPNGSKIAYSLGGDIFFY